MKYLISFSFPLYFNLWARFLETTANPYILAMGDPQTATRRLNFAQSFNPIWFNYRYVCCFPVSPN